MLGGPFAFISVRNAILLCRFKIWVLYIEEISRMIVEDNKIDY